MTEVFNAFFLMLHSMSPYLLLGFLIAGVLHAWVPAGIYSRYLGDSGWRSVAMAALLGVPLPLCSCGVLPTTVALRRSGASRAASTSFLIATPQTGVDSIAATYSVMGLPFAVLRPIAALVTALAGGMAVGVLERRGKLDDTQVVTSQETAPSLPSTVMGRIVETLRYAFVEMMQNIGRWLLLGLVVATLITVLVPDDFFSQWAQWPLVNMLVIVVVAVPMYVCATGSIPIAAALMLKGLSPGCALVLLMAGPAASVASMIVVSNALGRRTMMVYFASIVIGAMAFGLGVDYWPGLRETVAGAMPAHMHDTHGHGMSTSWFNWVCSVAFIVMMTWGIVSRYLTSYTINNKKTRTMKEVKVKGMMCNHCKAAVERCLAALPGVTGVTVDLARGVALVEGDVDDEVLAKAVVDLGYEVG